MAFALRDYQHLILEDTRALLRAGSHSVLIQSPTGSGKTALCAHMMGTASGRGHRAWFVVHRRELTKQSIATFDKVGIPHGVVAAGFPPDPRQLVQIGSIQTLVKRFDRLQPPRLIVWDECHHLAAGSWSQVHAAFPEAVHIGLSATPERLDGTGLSRWFDHLVEGPTVAELIGEGWLVPYRLFAPAPVDLSSVRTTLGDFAKGQLAGVMDRPTITGDAIAHYQRYAAGRRAVVFCVSVEHSRHVVAQFTAAGIAAAHVDGESHPIERDDAIARFERGEIQVLSNVELFGEGFDLPAIECVIMLRPTHSLALYLQQCGRGLRPAPGKGECIILDHAGNSQRHGLPDDPRAWSLEGRKKPKASTSAQVPVRTCLRCFATVPAAAIACKHCGFAFQDSGAREVEQVDGELVEVAIDPIEARRVRNREQAKAQTLEDLIALGMARGYRNPTAWASHIWQARQRRSA